MFWARINPLLVYSNDFVDKWFSLTKGMNIMREALLLTDSYEMLVHLKATFRVRNLTVERT